MHKALGSISAPKKKRQKKDQVKIHQYSGEGVLGILVYS
jgi:hypothetical protein